MASDMNIRSNNMYKICHMTSAHPSDDIRIFHKECVSLAKREDFEVYLVATGESREEAGVHVIGIGPKPESRSERMKETTKKVYEKALALDADIYHFHDPELLPSGAKLASKGYAVIFDSHEMVKEQILIKPYLPKWSRKAIAAFYSALEGYCLKNVSGIIAPCDYHGHHPYAGRTKRAVYVNNTPKRSEFGDAFRGYHRDFTAEPVACYVGSLAPNRGITELIDGCYQAGIRLILAGGFETEEYRQMLEAKPSYSVVDYRGYCNREQVADIYREATVGASTILNIGQYANLENLPTKVYEYMAVGLPMVMTDFPFGRKENEAYDFAELVDPSNPEDIAEKLRLLRDHPERAEELSRNGRRVFEERYNWGVDEARLYALYDDVLEEKNHE